MKSFYNPEEAIREAGLFGPKPRKKTQTSLDKFSKDSLYWTFENWSKVLFSDVHCIEVMGMCMLEEWLVKSLMITMITESVRIMVWRCIHSTGVGFLTNVEGRLNGDAYLH